MIGRALNPRAQVRAHLALARRLDAHGSRMARGAANLVRYRLARCWGVYIHPSARVGDVWFAHPTAVVIGAGAVVEDGVTLYQGVTLGAKDNDEGRYPVVRTGSTVYAGAVVIGGVTIGPDATVGANSVVTIDVPRGATAVGAPARLL